MYVPSVLVLLAGSTLASSFETEQSLPQRRPVQYRVSQDRAEAVKEAFQFAWDGYYQYAFPNDELHPLSKSFGNSRNGWGASAIDALSTATVMELGRVVDDILTHVPTINWRKTDHDVSVFETTIRYLGGLVSGYDLLTGPFSSLITNSSKVEPLLTQAGLLGDALAPAFKTVTGMPDNNINITDGSLRTSDQSTGLAVAGSLILEWTRLSDLLNDTKYDTLARKAEDYLLKPTYTPPFKEPWPGLEGQGLNYTTGQFTDASGGWVGGSDSFYEYLIKTWIYDPEKFSLYKKRWQAAADSSIAHLASTPSSRLDLTFIAAYSNGSLAYYSEHLACFAGGNFILGGWVLDREDYVDFGLKLTAGCHDTYVEDKTRIGPEIFRWLPDTCPSGNSTSYGSPAGSIAGTRGSKQRGKRSKSKSKSHPNRRRQHASSPNLALVSHTLTAAVAHPTVALQEANNIRCDADECFEDATSTDTTTIPTSCYLPASATTQADFYAKSGFWVDTNTYDLRPEVIESYYYAYRYTGDTKYQEWAWDAFLALNKTARRGVGFSSFSGVNSDSTEIRHDDNQESFFFAEVMKYSYLIHSEDGPWQVGYEGRQDFVFNTEAHPIKARSTDDDSKKNAPK